MTISTYNTSLLRKSTISFHEGAYFVKSTKNMLMSENSSLIYEKSDISWVNPYQWLTTITTEKINNENNRNIFSTKMVEGVQSEPNFPALFMPFAPSSLGQ